MKKVIYLLIIPLLLLPQLIATQANGQNDMTIKPIVQCIYHKVQKGETVYSIAKRYNADVTQIFKLNPGCKDVLWAGATLLVPAEGLATIGTINTDTLHIRERLEEFIGEATELANSSMDDMDDINEVTKKLNTLNTKWNVYYQAKQGNIADNDSLTEIATKFQQLTQEVKDTLAGGKNRLQLISDFSKAEKFIASQVSIYQQLTTQAEELSLASALAPKLEALKAKEQLLISDIDQHYETAQNAVGQNAELKKRMNQINNNYVKIKGFSEKIQAAEYKPLFTRIKDYLFGFAAVTIIMMFANMMHSKIQAAKQAKEAAKKMAKFRQVHDDEYPTI